MKKALKTGLSLTAMMGLGILLAAPAFAACPEGSVDTNLFGCVSGENGDGIYLVLNVILTVMTFGVGILGTLGIVIAGVQYATAKDNDQQMAKAKTRIFQIVIGMAIWAALYFILRWLLPGFQNSVAGN